MPSTLTQIPEWVLSHSCRLIAAATSSSLFESFMAYLTTTGASFLAGSGWSSNSISLRSTIRRNSTAAPHCCDVAVSDHVPSPTYLPLLYWLEKLHRYGDFTCG